MTTLRSLRSLRVVGGAHRADKRRPRREAEAR